MNKIILIGNLGRDPEMSYTPNGVAVTKFSLAVSRTEKSAAVKDRERLTGSTLWHGVNLPRPVTLTYVRGTRYMSRVALHKGNILIKIMSSVLQ